MKIAALDGEDAELIGSMLGGIALDGQCYELAVALHRGTGLPMVGLWSPTASGDDGIPGTWRHAAVRLGEGYVDARGVVSADELGRPFGEPRPWDVHDIAEEDLLAVRPVRPGSVATLGKLAQALWPDLPWKPTSFHGRMQSFLDDLEALSRRHGVWIRSAHPAARPLLSEEELEDKVSYEAGLTLDGLGVRFDRRFD